MTHLLLPPVITQTSRLLRPSYLPWKKSSHTSILFRLKSDIDDPETFLFNRQILIETQKFIEKQIARLTLPLIGRTQAENNVHVLIRFFICFHQIPQRLIQRIHLLPEFRCFGRIVFRKCLVEQLQQCVHLPLIICRVLLQILNHVLYNFRCMSTSHSPDTFHMCHIHHCPFLDTIFSLVIYGDSTSVFCT